MIVEMLIELTWKSSLVAAAVLGLLAVMRSQDPANRVAVGGLGLGLLLALPLVILSFALLPMPGIELPTPAGATVATVPMAMEPGGVLLPFSPAPEAAAATALPSPELVLLAIWGAGLLFVILRLAAGLVTLQRWTERAQLVAAPEWRVVMRRCGVPDSTLLLASSEISAPLSWGWRMPVILIDQATLANCHEAEAVIAHEAAHLSRGDWPRLIAARLVVALFWFNPLVWLLERLYLQDIEEAADADATRRVDPAHYAQALLNAARNAAVPLAANSMASGAISKRIRQVLTRRPHSRWERTWRIGALASVAAIAAPVAAVQFVTPAMSAAVAATPLLAPVAPIAPAHPITVVAPVAAASPLAPAEPAAAAAPLAVALTAVQAVAPPAPEPIDREAIEDALAAAQEARAHAMVSVRDANQIAAQARAHVAASMIDMRRQMLDGARQMDQGAVQMQRGAAQMREEARKLRDPAYRRKVMAENAARGHPTTEQELIDAIPKMEEGARKMDAGVGKMRDGAAKMRAQAGRQ